MDNVLVVGAEAGERSKCQSVRELDGSYFQGLEQSARVGHGRAENATKVRRDSRHDRVESRGWDEKEREKSNEKERPRFSRRELQQRTDRPRLGPGSTRRDYGKRSRSLVRLVD